MLLLIPHGIKMSYQFPPQDTVNGFRGKEFPLQNLEGQPSTRSTVLYLNTWEGDVLEGFISPNFLLTKHWSLVHSWMYLT